MIHRAYFQQTGGEVKGHGAGLIQGQCIPPGVSDDFQTSGSIFTRTAQQNAHHHGGEVAGCRLHGHCDGGDTAAVGNDAGVGGGGGGQTAMDIHQKMAAGRGKINRAGHGNFTVCSVLNRHGGEVR